VWSELGCYFPLASFPSTDPVAGFFNFNLMLSLEKMLNWLGYLSIWRLLLSKVEAVPSSVYLSEAYQHGDTLGSFNPEKVDFESCSSRL